MTKADRMPPPLAPFKGDPVTAPDWFNTAQAETVETGFAEEGELIGNNLAAHIEGLEKDMRDAAADLDFERAAALRDEIKRLQEVELAIADDPLNRDAGVENTQSARRIQAKAGKRFPDKGQPKGKIGTANRGDSKGINPASVAAQAEATSRSASASTDGGPDGSAEPKPKTKFRKNTLDEMTVGRTETPRAPEGWSTPRASWAEEQRTDRGTNSAYGTPLAPGEKDDPGEIPSKPVRRNKIGIGSYEDEQGTRGATGRSPGGETRRGATGRSPGAIPPDAALGSDRARAVPILAQPKGGLT